MNHQTNEVRDLLISSITSISDDDPNNQLKLNEFPQDDDSTFLVRERARGSKFESVFCRRHGQSLDEFIYTLPFLQTGKATPRLPSKRDVALSPPTDGLHTRVAQSEEYPHGVANQNEAIRM